jgi:hypothetical protein
VARRDKPAMTLSVIQNDRKPLNCTGRERAKAKIQATSCSSLQPPPQPELPTNYGVTQVYRFQDRHDPAGPDHGRSDKVVYDRIAPLTAEEMSALARRFEARAASVLLRDQPQMQADMRLAARLINEWTRHAGAIDDALHPRSGQAPWAETA